jgi:hypothetical protein
VHYNFVVWLQYALLGTALFAIVKAVIVFSGTLVLSWIAVLVVQHIPFGAQLIGAPATRGRNVVAALRDALARPR